LQPEGLGLAKKRGHKSACVAVARRLAVIMHGMWQGGTEFRFKAAPDAADAATNTLAKRISAAA